jgi:TonB-dependent receptor
LHGNKSGPIDNKLIKETKNYLKYTGKVVLGLVGAYVLLCLESYADALKIDINIEAQKTEDALLDLAELGAFHIVFSSDVVRNNHSPPVHGLLTVKEALHKLLIGTDLNYEINNNRIRIKKKPPEVIVLPLLIEEVVVAASYRKSLQVSLDIKRNTTAFIDVISAEDAGKFPDNNLAESLQRISGVQISRNNGEGQHASVRGLGPSFSRVLLDGLPISMASEGAIDQGAENREFDFDVFPSEIFSAVEVYKTPSANLIEGGVSSTVNLKSAHPFDFDGFVGSFSLEQVYSENTGKFDPKNSFFVSNTWGNTFGVLMSVAKTKRTFQTEGFDTQGWARGRVPGVEPEIGRTGFEWNLSDGNHSGLTDNALANARVSRMSRPEFNAGERDRLGVYTAFQWKPADTININLDVMFAQLEQQYARYVNNMVVRNTGESRVDTAGWITPRNLVVNDNTVVSGTLDGVRFWSENRQFQTDTDFLQVALSGDWKPLDWVRLDWKVAKSTSNYEDRNISYFFNSTPTVSSFVVRDELVVVSPGIALTDVSHWAFDGFRVDRRVREEKNTTFKFDITLGDHSSNLTLGVLYHEFVRDRVNYHWGERDTSEIMRLAGFAAGSVASDLDAALVSETLDKEWGGSLGVSPGYSNWLVSDFEAFAAQGFDPDLLFANVPQSSNDTGGVSENSLGGYLEANLTSQLWGREVRINAGVRVVTTEVASQTYFKNNEGEFFQVEDQSDYSASLPSFNLAANMTDELVLRFAGSRSMSRPNPSLVSSSVGVSRDNGAVSQGNAQLQPFFANLFDIGLEWYFDSESILAVSYFYKNISGWIETEVTQEPFRNSGLSLEELDAQQRATLNQGLHTLVDFKRPHNSQDKTQIKGVEFLYQQTLDEVLPGLGVIANYAGARSAGDRAVTGFSDKSYNLILYYERSNYNMRVSYNYRSEYPRCTAFCRDGQPQGRYQSAAGYVDLSLNYILPIALNHKIELSFEALNVTNEQELSYWGDPSTMRLLFRPGRQFSFGIKGKI